MQVLTCNPNGGAFLYILNGIRNALRIAGNIIGVVSSGNVPTDFDLYLGCSGWRQSIPPKNKRKGKVGIHVNPYGNKKVGSADGGPVIDETQSAIQWVIANQPDFVFCYCSSTFTKDYFGHWERAGIPVIGLPTAADISIYSPHKSNKKFECEIGWVGGKWPYKAKMLNKYMSPLISKKKCQIYGWGNSWGNGKAITDGEVPILFSSAKICPSVSESHTVLHPVDVPERVFKVPASGGFTVHTPSVAIPDLFGDTVPMAKDVQQWMGIIDFYLGRDDKRKKLAKEQQQLVLDKHTYFDRCLMIADVIGNKKLRQDLVSAKARIVAWGSRI